MPPVRSEALACIMAITEGVIPPTINNFNRDPNIDARINLTLNTAQERDVRVAIGGNALAAAATTPPSC